MADLESGSAWLLLEAPVLLALVEVEPPPTRLLDLQPFFFSVLSPPAKSMLSFSSPLYVQWAKIRKKIAI